MIYLISDDEYLKIGYSVSPAARLADLQTGNARPLILLGTIEGTTAYERFLHAKYEHLNVRQEWFEFDTSILAEFGIQEGIEHH